MSSWFYLTALLLPPMLIIGGLVMLTRGGRKKEPDPTTAGVPAKEKEPLIFKDGWHWKAFQFALVAIALAFVFFYDWGSTPPGEVLQPMMGDKWFLWTIKAFAVLLGIVYVAKLVFPKTEGKGGMGVLSFLLWLLIAGGVIGTVAVWVTSYISAPKAFDHEVVNMSQVQIGGVTTIEMGVYQWVPIEVGMARVKDSGYVDRWLCPKATGKVPLRFEWKDSGFVISKLSREDLKASLAENTNEATAEAMLHTLKVPVSITVTASPLVGAGNGSGGAPSKNPCPYASFQQE